MNHYLQTNALKVGRQEVPGSIPGRACRPSSLEFFMVFSETRINTGEDFLERPPTEGTPFAEPGPISVQLTLTLQPTNQIQTDNQAQMKYV